MDQATPPVSKRFIDRTGQRFGRLIAIHLAEDRSREPNATRRWLCRCDCGNELVVSARDLSRGHTKSCGCLRMGPRRGCLPGEAAFNFVLRTYRDNARKRGLSWELSQEDFKRLTLQDCFYCGAPPSMVRSMGKGGSGQWVHNGLDRPDNTQGYFLENVVPCCKICNHAKKDMTYDEFMAWIARLTEYHWFHPEMTPSSLLIPQEQHMR